MSVRDMLRRKGIPFKGAENRCGYHTLKLNYEHVECLVGRRDQVKELSSVLKDKAPAVILIRGIRKVGKTTLIQTVIRNLKLDPFHIYIDVENFIRYPSSELEEKLAEELVTSAADRSLLVDLPVTPPTEVVKSWEARKKDSRGINGRELIEVKKETDLKYGEQTVHRPKLELEYVLKRIHPKAIVTVDEMQTLQPIYPMIVTALRKIIQENQANNRKVPKFIFTGSLASAVETFKESIKGAGWGEGRLTEIEIPSLTASQSLELLVRCLIDKGKLPVPNRINIDIFAMALAAKIRDSIEDEKLINALRIPNTVLNVCAKIPAQNQYKHATKDEILELFSKSIALWLLKNRERVYEHTIDEVYKDELVNFATLAIKLADSKIKKGKIKKPLNEIIAGIVKLYNRLGKGSISKTAIDKSKIPGPIATELINLLKKNSILKQTKAGKGTYFELIGLEYQYAAKSISISDFKESAESLKKGLINIPVSSET